LTETLHGIQLTHRCAWHDGEELCAAPAPYLVSGTSFCHDHALSQSTVLKFRGDLPPEEVRRLGETLKAALRTRPHSWVRTG